MMRDSFNTQDASRGGFVLVLVLIVIAMLSLAGYAFTELMFTEYKATHVQGRHAQARLAAESGVEAMKAYCALTVQERQERGGHFNNPDMFQGIVIADLGPGELPARYTIIAPPLSEEDPPRLRFGLSNESSKLNLHAVRDWESQQAGAGRNALLALPGMTEEIADAILDWIDGDDEPREFGAESEYYGRLEPPYSPANAVPQVLEELLWVRGVTPRMLFGEDRNENGYIDASEAQWSTTASHDPQLNVGQFGWSTWLTLHSAEGNRTASGQPKIKLNQSNMRELYDQLVRAFDEEWATFIVAFRQFGPYLGPDASASGRPLPPSFDVPAKYLLASPLDLVGVRVEVALPDVPAFVLPCPFENNRAAMLEYLPRLMDLTTVDPEQVVGRIDVNEAAREVLMAVPALSAGLVEDILAKRGREPGVVDETQRHVTWLLTEGLVELEQMKELLKYLTVGGDVFRAQTIGYLEDGSIFRAEFVLDATLAPARLISWRNLERLGRGYDLTVLGITPRGATPQQTPTPASSTQP